MPAAEKRSIEIRVFGRLSELVNKRNWPTPVVLKLEKPVSGADLADLLEIPLEDVEVVIVNGAVRELSCSIQPGDRVAFVPPGTPGPYRVLLGFIKKERFPSESTR